LRMKLQHNGWRKNQPPPTSFSGFNSCKLCYWRGCVLEKVIVWEIFEWECRAVWSVCSICGACSECRMCKLTSFRAKRQKLIVVNICRKASRPISPPIKFGGAPTDTSSHFKVTTIDSLHSSELGHSELPTSLPSLQVHYFHAFLQIVA
jgi:hypothetical protein